MSASLNALVRGAVDAAARSQLASKLTQVRKIFAVVVRGVANQSVEPSNSANRDDDADPDPFADAATGRASRTGVGTSAPSGRNVPFDAKEACGANATCGASAASEVNADARTKGNGASTGIVVDLPLAFLRLLHAHVRQKDERYDERAGRRGGYGSADASRRPIQTTPSRAEHLRNGTALTGPFGGSKACGGSKAFGGSGSAGHVAVDAADDRGAGGANGEGATGQLPLWDALPVARRADHPEANLAALLFEGMSEPDAAELDWLPLIELARSADWDRLASVRTAGKGGSGARIAIDGWSDLDSAPIPLVNDARRGTDDHDPTCRAFADAVPAGDLTALAADPTAPADSPTAPADDPVVDSSLAARRRRELPGLLSPATALLAVMLGRALDDRPGVAADLVHGAPVVLVRVPDGVPANQIEGAVDMCLPCWPLPTWTTAPARANAAVSSLVSNAGCTSSESGCFLEDGVATDADPLAHVPRFDRARGNGSVAHPYDMPLADFGAESDRDADEWPDDLDDDLDGWPLVDARSRDRSSDSAPSDDPLAGVLDHHRATLRRISTIDANSTDAKSFGGRPRNRGGRHGGYHSAGGTMVDSIVTLQAKRNTVLVVASPDADVPPSVVALADHTIELQLPDPDALALAVRAVTGEMAAGVPDGLYAIGTAPEPDRPLEAAVAAHAANSSSCPPPHRQLRLLAHDATPLPRFSFAHAIGSLSAVRGAVGSLQRLARLADAAAVRNDDGVSASSENTPPLDQLAGYGRAKVDGLAIAEDLRAYKQGALGWGSVARGLVLAGPPGTGKSLFARALATSAGVPLVVGSIADWQAAGDGHLGDMLRAMRECFDEARRNAPCILFIDELDSIGDRRSFPERHRSYSTQVVNALLQHLDGAVGREGVVVCGATNHPGDIDPAILRPGRLERVVMIELPDIEDLIGMLRTHLTGVMVVIAAGPTGDAAGRARRDAKVGAERVAGNPVDEPNERNGDSPANGPANSTATNAALGIEGTSGIGEANGTQEVNGTQEANGTALPDRALRPVALALRGRTGADVNACVQRARADARRAKRTLTIADLLDAARAGRDVDYPPLLARRASVHEAGHAVVAFALGAGTVHHLSLDPDGGTTRIADLATEQTAADYEGELAVLFGGRAAELAILGNASAGVGAGPASDLARATRRAALMHTSFGLGGSLVYAGTLEDEHSLRLAIGPVRADVERTLAAAQDRALQIVREHRVVLEVIAERLQHDTYVSGADAKAMWDERGRKLDGTNTAV